MKIILILLIFISASFSQTFIREYTYDASEKDSKITARNAALDEVKKLLIEELGVFVQRTIKRKVSEENGKIDEYFEIKDNIVSRFITKTKILEEKWNGEKYYIKAEITIDPNELDKYIEIYSNFTTSNELRKNTKKNYINSDNVIIVKGFGIANKSFPRQIWKESAKKAALLDAQRKILELLNGSELSSETIIENFQMKKDLVIKKIKGNLKYIEQISKVNYPTEDTSEIIIKIKLKKN